MSTLVASRRRLLDNEELLAAVEQTRHDMEQWATTLTSIIVTARAEAEIISTRPEGVKPNAGDGRTEGSN